MRDFIDSLTEFISFGTAILIDFLVITFTILLALAIILYIVDICQTKHAIRRNYPLIGRFRYLFEDLGEFFRQYFFSMDREEMPFNRAQRSWVYRAAKDLDNTQAFGSSKDISKLGNILFVNAGFPLLEEEATEMEPVLFGPFCHKPYLCPSIFNISAMSYGAISKPAIKALAGGAAQAGCWLNTGEGGLTKWHLKSGCDIVFQIGTAKYSVRDEHGELNDDRLRKIAEHQQVRMFELKLSQGAKPGKGGILPAAKVTEEIAEIRGITPHVASISPNRHLDINNNADLLDRMSHIRQITGKPVGFKTVLGETTWLDELFTLINEKGLELAPDFITLDSADGGTGAAPLTLIDDMGLDVTETLPVLVNKLNEYQLRDRIKVIVSGKLINPADVAWALCVGADCVVTARGFMFALGCIQAMQCNKNTCPTGITTHNKRLQRGLVPKDKARRVAYYQKNMMKELGVIAHACGVENPRLLQRRHARLVVSPRSSIGLDSLYDPL